MNVNGIPTRSISPLGHRGVRIIDQTRLPWSFKTLDLFDCDAIVTAISSMQVRGAPLIGVSAAYGVALAAARDASNGALTNAFGRLAQSRPTAVNLHWALQRMRDLLMPLVPGARAEAAWQEATEIAEEDVALNRAIGAHAAALIKEVHTRSRRTVKVLTHCNAGWLATVDFGTALSGIFQAHDAGIPLQVWVDETRPRNQGLLTAWELRAHGIAHTVVVDSAGGHLMQHGEVDLVLVGADRVSARGDVCNKIGTYLKALAAHDNGVPFYAAVPSPTIDWKLTNAMAEIPIESRDGAEVRRMRGLRVKDSMAGGHMVSDAPGLTGSNDVGDDLGIADATVQIALLDDDCAVDNPAFDVTPARLVTGIITERGVDTPDALAARFERRAA